MAAEPTFPNPDLYAVPAVERAIGLDMARRALPVLPVLVAISAAVWGWRGAVSSTFGFAIALVNLLVAAIAMSWAARRSPALLMGVSMFGYLLRLGLITAAVLAVHSQSWVEIVPLGVTIIITHLGLLFWELRFVSISFTYPGLKPLRSPS